MSARKLLANLNLANQLTFLRLVAIPFFIISVLQARFATALALFVAAAITDALDGLTARLFKQGTPLGAYLDPAADKLLLTSAFVVLTDYPSMFQDIPMIARIPIWLTIITISRDVFITVVSAMLYIAHGQTRFRPSIWGKLTTVGESLTVGLFLLHNALGRNSHVLDAMVWITLALALISGFHYLGRTTRMLRENADESEARR